ncbi:hypothetical protein FACS189491_05650 [Spirochaetia bacterium]|nr:hypothetical protein FACS189491_05650 [Spirochaetia bacterium]
MIEPGQKFQIRYTMYNKPESFNELPPLEKFKLCFKFILLFDEGGDLKYRIEGKIISAGKFDNVYLLTSENGKNTAAIFEYRYTKIEFDLGIRWGPSESPGFYKEKYPKYRLVNLVTGKTIIPTSKYLLYGTESVGDYFLVGSDLYQFLDNGEIQCVTG